MGGAVSAGENNDELIDNLVTANYITSKEIEEIFRAVDRGLYFLNEFKDSAYQDLAWRHEHLHISAPCIYSKVLSYLDLKPGQSFLNIGSGTGYFSTLAGLILGSGGINHGVELHEDVVDYARKKVKEFISQSLCFDRYMFCEPEFVVGNCLHIAPESPGYDRIYCGAACPTEYESFMKNLLNQNGVLIMPSNDQLQVITRTGQSKWETSNILVVSFATLVVPSNDERQRVTELPTRNPRSLYVLCRFRIRQILSRNCHHGSNRRFKRKRHISDVEESSRMTLSDDDSSPSTHSSDDAQSKPRTPKSGSILDISTCTLITFGDDSKEETSHSSHRQDGSSTSGHGDGEKSSVSLKKKLRSRKSMSFKKSTKSKKDPEPKKSKAKKGWDLIRRKFKNRKTEQSIFSSTPTKETEASESMDDSRLQPKTDSEDEASVSQESSSDVRPQSSTDHDAAPQISLRSFLLGMTTQLNSTVSDRAALRDGFYSYVDRQRRLVRMKENDKKKVDDVKSDDDSEEIVFSNRDFHSAILSLPLPEPIKRFLLFYRCPN